MNSSHDHRVPGVISGFSINPDRMREYLVSMPLSRTYVKDQGQKTSTGVWDDNLSLEQAVGIKWSQTQIANMDLHTNFVRWYESNRAVYFIIRVEGNRWQKIAPFFREDWSTPADWLTFAGTFEHHVGINLAPKQSQESRGAVERMTTKLPQISGNDLKPAHTKSHASNGRKTNLPKKLILWIPIVGIAVLIVIIILADK